MQHDEPQKFVITHRWMQDLFLERSDTLLLFSNVEIENNAQTTRYQGLLQQSLDENDTYWVQLYTYLYPVNAILFAMANKMY